MGDDRLGWWSDARFGLFVHWGPYSVAGVEASWPIMVPALARLVPQPEISEAEYVGLAARFDPRGFDPKAWVALARRAGMRYVVFTAKHHDGFCMFDAPGTEYKITRTPYRRDVLAMLAEACADVGMPLGVYYSPPDMHHPGYRDTSRPVSENWQGQPERAEWASYLDYMESHVRRLLTDYGEIAIVWWDGLFDHERYQPERFAGLVRELSPRTLTNDRLGGGDYVTPEQFTPEGIPVRRQGPAPGLTRQAFEGFLALLGSGRPVAELEAMLEAGRKTAYPTAEHPSADQLQPWETCMTLNRTWGWNPSDDEWKSPQALVLTLIETASRGGNFLLNVGPRGDGALPDEAAARLEAVGGWMERYGESIHGTSYGPVQGLPAVRSTRRGEQVYLHLPQSAGGTVEVRGLETVAGSLAALGGGAIDFERVAGGIRFARPERAAPLGVDVVTLRSRRQG